MIEAADRVAHEGHEGHEGEGNSGTQTATDPVCGMQIAPATAPEHREAPGGRLPFCSTHCATTYDQDPDRYAALSAAHGHAHHRSTDH